MEHAAALVPSWAQDLGIIVIGIVSVILGVYKYIKTEVKDASSKIIESSTVSASFIDSRVLRDLIEAIREHQDEQSKDLKRNHRMMQDLKDAVNALSEATVLQTDASVNIVRFLNREIKKNDTERLSTEINRPRSTY